MRSSTWISAGERLLSRDSSPENATYLDPLPTAYILKIELKTRRTISLPSLYHDIVLEGICWDAKVVFFWEKVRHVWVCLCSCICSGSFVRTVHSLFHDNLVHLASLLLRKLRHLCGEIPVKVSDVIYSLVQLGAAWEHIDAGVVKEL